MPNTVFSLLLLADTRLFVLAFIYGVALSLLTLAVPFSVQVLVETVANTALPKPVLVLALLLFGLLAFYCLLYALQVYIMELFERRFFARVAGEIGLRGLYADHAYLETVHREDLFNRYFDIMTVQKNLPLLFTGGLALFLQMLVGFVVVSLYHPLFLVFTIAYLGFALLVWQLFDGPARRTAAAVSTAKYQVARWLEGIARHNLFYKVARHREVAVERTHALTNDYVRCHRRHFNVTFSQTVGFLLLYALGSAGLLGVAGWLVVLGELTLGQLVAAELILSAVFAGVIRIGYFLKLYYELTASLDKLGYFLRLPLEAHRGVTSNPSLTGAVSFRDLVVTDRHRHMRFDFNVAAGEVVLVAVTASGLVRACRDALLGLKEPDSGHVQLGPVAVGDIEPAELRQQVQVVDLAQIPDVSIAELLAMARADVTRVDMREALQVADLNESIAALPDGLDTVLLPDGGPLSLSETLRLRLAHAWLARPAVLIMTPIVDAIRVDHRERLLAAFRAEGRTTVLYFSNRRDLPQVDRYLLLTPEGHRMAQDLTELCRLEAEAIPMLAAAQSPVLGGAQHGQH